MEIMTMIILHEGDTAPWTATEAATNILAALSGNEASDYCKVDVQTAQAGEVGTRPTPPPL